MNLELLSTLSILTENQREVLVDRLVLNRTPSAIARSMGTDLETVRGLERRAQALARLLLEADRGGA